MESVVINKNTPVEEGKLLKASKVALTGVGVAILAGIITNAVSYAFSGEITRIVAKYAPSSSAFVQGGQFLGIGMQVVIFGIFFWLAFSLRKSKTRAIATNLIVFSSIFTISNILTIAIAFMSSGVYEVAYKGITSQELQTLKQSMYYSQALVVLSIVAWSIVLAGGIIGVRAPEAELEENRLVD